MLRIGRLLITLSLTLALSWGLAGAASADNIYVDGKTSGYNTSITFYGSSKTVSTAELKIDVNNFQDVIGYCIDLYQSFSYNTNYTYTMYAIDQTMATLQAGWLMGHYAPGLGYAHVGYSTAATITALQLAIWEVTYDYAATYASNALDTGNFIAYNVANESTVVRSLANQFLAAIPTQLAQLSLTGLNYSGVARNSYKQDFVVGATPEPGSMLLFGSAAGLLGWWRRRKGQDQDQDQA